MKIVILAAGIGSRLGNAVPKALAVLRNGSSIMAHQVGNLTRYFSIHDILVVVGFKKELIMEAFPQLTYVYNDRFDTTNTSKSLLCAVTKIRDEDFLWLNGDVVFDHRVINRMLRCGRSCMAVRKGKVGEEEIKYTLRPDGSIKGVSKVVKAGVGEALGINLLKADSLDLFADSLAKCSDHDYFERAIEYLIARSVKIYPIDVTDLNCVEVDFQEDLEVANTFLEKKTG